jgi:predicted nucleic acid-binding protein
VTVVIDASVVVAALSDSGPEGIWAEQLLISDDLAAPHLMPVEAANVLRLAALARDISQDSASLAHADLLSLPVELFPYEPIAPRVWELRTSITAYDACYVALAEALGTPLATLDRRLTRAAGARCEFMTFAR